MGHSLVLKASSNLGYASAAKQAICYNGQLYYVTSGSNIYAFSFSNNTFTLVDSISTGVSTVSWLHPVANKLYVLGYNSGSNYWQIAAINLDTDGSFIDTYSYTYCTSNFPGACGLGVINNKVFTSEYSYIRCIEDTGSAFINRGGYDVDASSGSARAYVGVINGNRVISSVAGDNHLELFSYNDSTNEFTQLVELAVSGLTEWGFIDADNHYWAITDGGTYLREYTVSDSAFTPVNSYDVGSIGCSLATLYVTDEYLICRDTDSSPDVRGLAVFKRNGASLEAPIRVIDTQLFDSNREQFAYNAGYIFVTKGDAVQAYKLEPNAFFTVSHTTVRPNQPIVCTAG